MKKQPGGITIDTTSNAIIDSKNKVIRYPIGFFQLNGNLKMERKQTFWYSMLEICVIKFKMDSCYSNEIVHDRKR